MDSDVLPRDAIRADPGLQDRSAYTSTVSSQESAATRTNCGFHPSELPIPFAERGARLILDENRRVVWATDGAILLASSDSCISIANGEFGGRTRHSDTLLRDMCVDAQNAADGIAELLIAPEASHCPDLFVRAQSHSVPGATFTLLTIRNLARDLEEIPDLGRLYGLTRTEQQITRMMVQGQSVTEIGIRLHKSVLTVRTHVKRAYSKLGVGTKEQLFSTVMKLMVD